jgi:metal-sulfur cluster biosynthetic enzyme
VPADVTAADAVPADVTAVLHALDSVLDPELDQPITSLGFVASCEVSPDGRATIRLRLPTYFCAPNFAFMMVADARDAVSVVHGVRATDVRLEDHFAARDINGAATVRTGNDLRALRVTFARKAVLAGTDRVCRPLLAAGTCPGELAALTLADLPPSPELDRLRRRRAELGLPAGADAPLLIDPSTGAAVAAEQAAAHLRRARTVRTGADANASICTGMLSRRYQEEDQ